MEGTLTLCKRERFRTFCRNLLLILNGECQYTYQMNFCSSYTTFFTSKIRSVFSLPLPKTKQPSKKQNTVWKNRIYKNITKDPFQPNSAVHDNNGKYKVQNKIPTRWNKYLHDIFTTLKQYVSTQYHTYPTRLDIKTMDGILKIRTTKHTPTQNPLLLTTTLHHTVQNTVPNNHYTPPINVR